MSRDLVSTHPLLERRGAAVPLALLILLALSLMASGLMIRSSTETAASVAHLDAATGIYAAEGAIHAWIAERGGDLQPEIVEPFVPPGGGSPVRITAERIARTTPGGTFSSPVVTYALTARADGVGGGRSISASIRVREAGLPLFDAELAAPVAALRGVLVVGAFAGDVRVSDGRDNPLCTGPAATADHAAVVASGAVVHTSGGATLHGDWRQSALSGSALADSLLGGLHLRDLAWNSDVRFGRYFNEPALPSPALPAADQTDARLRWGCPKDVIDAVRAAAPGALAPRACPPDADTARYVVVAIDAENGSAVLGGDHGQGVIIVVNGGLHLTGSFVYKGLILAEGDVTLSGGGPGWPPSVEGAVLAGGGVVIDGGLTPPGFGPTNGGRAVRFGRCAIDRARAAFNAREDGAWGTPRVLGRPFGWFEVVR